ncbi:hypothetical protein AAEX28_05615 [Lentisphaerota bacterium WC36G]|nr:hypothetical protein LJT99_08475 [Lentisphaerae bacterium WC36]
MSKDKTSKQILQEKIHEEMKSLRENESYEKLKKLLDDTYCYHDLHNQIKNIMMCLDEDSKDMKLVTRHELSRSGGNTRYLF